MKKRLLAIILVCIMCTIFIVCNSTNGTISLGSKSSFNGFSIDSIKKTLKEENFVSLKGSGTIFYYSSNYQVIILDYHEGGESQTSDKPYIDVVDFEVDGKSVYYDTENDCFTTKPIQND